MNFSLLQNYKLFFLFFLLFNTTLFANKAILTHEQQVWIDAHRTINVGVGPDWAPFDFVDNNGHYAGIANDYLTLIAENTGLHFHLIVDTWSHNLQKIKTKQIDLLDAVYKNEQRKEFMEFSAPYLELLDYFYIRDDLDVHTLEDLNGKRVAIPKGYAHGDIIRRDFPKIQIVEVATFSDSVDAVIEGRADMLFDTQISLSYKLEKDGIRNIIPFKSYRKHGLVNLYMASYKGNKMLISIINAGLAAITKEQKREIFHRWVNSERTKNQLVWTPQEQQWLHTHKTIRYTAIESKPVSFVKGKKLSGMAGEYLDSISKKTGLQFSYVAAKNFQEALHLFQTGAIDMIPTVAKSKFISQLGLLTHSYIDFPFVLITKNSRSFISSIDELEHKTVAVPKYWSSYNYLVEQKPTINVIATNNIFEALDLVKKKKADASLVQQAAGMYYVGTYYSDSLHIAGRVDYDDAQSFLVQKDQKILQSILNKVLHTIDEKQRQEIQNRWLHIEVSEAKDYALLFELAFFLALILAGSIYWNRKLTKEIKERKRVEAALNLAKEHADAANKAKSEFLANMSHEIRTPMNAIIGFTDLLYEQVEQPKLKGYAKTIQNAGNALLGIINDILDLSKIEAGKLQINKTAVDIHSICEDIGSIFMMNVRNKGIDLIIEIEESVPHSLLLDEIRIRQILFNIIGNAVKFTQQGYIRLHLSAEKQSNNEYNLKFSIEDTGIGIPQEQLEKIFLEFEQTQGQDNRKFGGTGLGLSISKRLTQMMGGEISVVSQEGKGSTFYIEFFHVQSSDEVAKTTVSSVEENMRYRVFAPTKIMVVDDVADNRALLVNIFADTDVAVLEAQDGYEAIELFKKEHPALIFMDLRMPKLDGYSAAREIKKLSNVPIVALTASVMRDEYERVKSEDFSAYLRKPVLKEELFEVMSNFLDYTDAYEATQEIEEEIISFEAFAHIDELKKIFDNEIIPLYEEAKQSNNMDDIEQFAQKLLAIAQRYEMDYVYTYARNVLAAHEVFDIIALESLLNDFQVIMIAVAEG